MKEIMNVATAETGKQEEKSKDQQTKKKEVMKVEKQELQSKKALQKEEKRTPGIHIKISRNDDPKP